MRHEARRIPRGRRRRHEALPRLTPIHDQIDEALGALESAGAVSADVLAALRHRHAVVVAELDGAGSADIVLHGDAHAGNLLHSSRGWMWTDLEEACAGPPEWDLAVLTGSGDIDGAVALQAYAEASGTTVPAEAGLAPFHRARELEATVWLLAMAHLYPERYQWKAAENLARLRLA